MIRYGNKNDIPGLKQLWKESFGDEDAYIDSFFKMLYQDRDVLLEEQDGMLWGASFFLPGRILMETGWQDVRYVYALAVYPVYRGKKIATRLLDDAGKRYGVPLITEPADAGLADNFYMPYGFERCFYLDYGQIDLSAKMFAAEIGVGLEMGCAQARPINANEYYNLREKHFQKYGYVSWPHEHIAFALHEHRRQGGDALLVTRGNREDLLLYTVDSGKIVVTETTFEFQDVIDYLPYLFSFLSSSHVGKPGLLNACSQVDIKSRIGKASHSSRFLGMAYGITLDNGYLNLTLD